LAFAVGRSTFRETVHNNICSDDRRFGLPFKDSPDNPAGMCLHLLGEENQEPHGMPTSFHWNIPFFINRGMKSQKVTQIYTENTPMRIASPFR
jgi:hypothetical protein